MADDGTMAPERFAALGAALYGLGWSRQLGERIGVNERAIRRWAKGDDVPPPGVIVDVSNVVAEELMKIAEAAAAALPGRFTIEGDSAGFFTVRVGPK